MKYRLKELREDYDIKKQVVADYLNMTRTNYSKIENELVTFSFDDAIKIADFYNISLEELLTKRPNFSLVTKEEKKKFADILKLLSKTQGKTQLDLAKFLGYSKGAVNQWYNGLTEPNIETLVKISKFYDVSLDFLLTGEEREHNCILIKKETYERILYTTEELNNLLKKK